MPRVIQDSDDEGDLSPIEIQEPEWPQDASPMDQGQQPVVGYRGLKRRPTRSPSESHHDSIKKHQTAIDPFHAEIDILEPEAGIAALAGLVNGAWNLPPSIQEAFNQHQPNIMFSEGSTIPNTTMTQHQLYQANQEPHLSTVLEGMSGEIGDADKTKSSLNWSEILQSQMEENQYAHENHLQDTEAEMGHIDPNGEFAVQQADQAVGPTHEYQDISYTPDGQATLLEVGHIPKAVLPNHLETPARRTKTKTPRRSQSKPEELSADELAVRTLELGDSKKKRKRGRPRRVATSPAQFSTNLEENHVEFKTTGVGDEQRNGSGRGEVTHDDNDTPIRRIAAPQSIEFAHDNLDDAIPKGEDSRAVVKVEIPREKSSDVQERVDSAPQQVESIAAEPASKKRGRGRPKKVPQKSPVEVMKDNTAAPTLLQPDPATGMETTSPLNNVSGNELKMEHKNTNHDAQDTGDTQSTMKIEQTVTANQPCISQEPEAKPLTSTRPPPVSKNGVPYRVGLSRRARLPSLLKIVRK